jgi:hypothetical protein
MSNDYTPDLTPLAPGDVARANDVNERYENMVAAFDKLPAPAVGKQGFGAPVPVGSPVEDDHAVNKLWAETAMSSQLTQATAAAATATAQAGIATDQAGVAATKASEANDSAVAASTHAGTATTQAGIATAQAGIATTKAAEAADSESVATAKANEATTQAGIATGAADDATAQAGIATSQAATATSAASAAANSSTLAQEWAEKAENAEITGSPGSYSAKHWASKAETFAGEAIGARNDVEQTLAIYTMDPLRRSVESASGGRMTVLYTAKGEPCYMHVLPKFMLEDVDPTLALGTGVHPAFIKGGTELTELFIGAYQAKVVGGEALSQPMQDPTTYVNYDQAKAYCAANGSGWHLMTNWEWAAIALWCMANGYEPLGNTNYGRHHDQRYQTGRRQDGGQPGNTSGTARTLTGSGPADWAHDKTPAGIHDLVGNVWEWQGGLKLQDGRVVMPADNDWDADESAWVAQDLWFSSGSATATTSALSLVTDAGSVVRNGTVGDDSNSGFYDYRSPWSALPITGTAPLSTQQALLAPAGIAPVGLAYARTYGERLPLRGGGWSNAGSAGLAALDLGSARTNAYSTVGFRPAFAT